MMDSISVEIAVESKRTWLENLETFIEYAPIGKKKILLGAASLEYVALAHKAGIDLVDDSWVERLSMEGRALIVSKESYNLENERIRVIDETTRLFDLTPIGKRSEGRGGEVSFVKPAEEWKFDLGLLDSKCGCWTCQRGHTRAYIHHLLCVNDMLSYVLLHHHNLWTVKSFTESL
jgi:queuine tRNA-ribosyltransferase subunit QTRTD1